MSAKLPLCGRAGKYLSAGKLEKRGVVSGEGCEDLVFPLRFVVMKAPVGPLPI